MLTSLEQQTPKLLAEIMELAPDIRIGQLLAHLGFMGEMHVDKGLGTIEDDEFVTILYRHRAELQARLDGRPFPPVPNADNGFSDSDSPLHGPSAAASS